ncbi:hypothetical protein OsJ_31079 [Oryza sativa Japonica Group]|uniref:Uncharacterized protein n=1 Tax=Oryza sativa subsp. japonica TaxID=39947 RepID=B9G811_ORYSJ|nr:hypothetical protein OsJ_31079 [Oryza sativa Japonica Group]
MVATTGKGEEKKTLTLALEEEARGRKAACSPEIIWRPEESAVPSPSPPGRAAPAVASSLHRRLLEENFHAASGDDLFPGLEKRETPWWAGLKSAAVLNRTHNFAWAGIFFLAGVIHGDWDPIPAGNGPTEQGLTGGIGDQTPKSIGPGRVRAVHWWPPFRPRAGAPLRRRDMERTGRTTSVAGNEEAESGVAERSVEVDRELVRVEAIDDIALEQGLVIVFSVSVVEEIEQGSDRGMAWLVLDLARSRM